MERLILTHNELVITSRESDKEILRHGKVTHVYGPPKIGKSTLSATIALELAIQNRNTIIISTERPIEIRMESMMETNPDYESSLLNNISTANIFTIEELVQTINTKLEAFIEDVDLIIIDSLTANYRANAGPIMLTLLRKAMSKLQAIAIQNNIAILFTNQVASKMDDTNDFRPVASASVRNYSDITIRLSPTFDGKTEISFEDQNGEEIEILSSFAITTPGIEDIRLLMNFND